MLGERPGGQANSLFPAGSALSRLQFHLPELKKGSPEGGLMPAPGSPRHSAALGWSAVWAALLVPLGRQQSSWYTSHQSGIGAEVEAGEGCAQADLEAVVRALKQMGSFGKSFSLLCLVLSGSLSIHMYGGEC